MGFAWRDIDLDPQGFHDLAPEVSGREVWVPALDSSTTLVLGSTQAEETIEHHAIAAAGMSLARRRSGGGAVLVSADDVVWFDLLITSGDELWTADVGKAFEWVGRVCQTALSQLGVNTAMHTGALISSPWSRSICFASLGPGELTTEGRKIVGISQRRTREVARFQVAILRRWDGHKHANLLHLSPEERLSAINDLASVATGIDASPTEVLTAIEASLPN